MKLIEVQNYREKRKLRVFDQLQDLEEWLKEGNDLVVWAYTERIEEYQSA